MKDLILFRFLKTSELEQYFSDLEFKAHSITRGCYDKTESYAFL